MTNAEKAVQVREATIPANVETVANAILRAANDPTIDPERLERFLAMYERLTARDAERAYDMALNAAQEEMRPVAKDLENQQTRSRYASFAALDKAVRPIYAKHGFSLSFTAGDGAPAECVRVVCRVSHREGHKEHPHIDMPADGKGAKGGDVMTKTHATGAAFTYGQRYLLKAIFNIAVGDDDDGNGTAQETNEELDFISEINDAPDAKALAAWKAKAGEAAAKYPRVIRAYNDRAGRLRHSDFPGDRR